MSVETVIATLPPDDGRDWNRQCARCGSSAGFMDCDNCVDGYEGHDCGEDSCCCLNPEDNVVCQYCEGRGGWDVCLSSEEWCKAHPLPGREQTERGAIEWYVVQHFNGPPEGAARDGETYVTGKPRSSG